MLAYNKMTRVADWDGRSYKAVNRLQRHLAASALDRLELRSDDDVLDVGCGDGRITALALGD